MDSTSDSMPGLSPFLVITDLMERRAIAQSALDAIDAQIETALGAIEDQIAALRRTTPTRRSKRAAGQRAAQSERMRDAWAKRKAAGLPWQKTTDEATQ